MGATDTENRLEPLFGMRSNEILIIHEESGGVAQYRARGDFIRAYPKRRDSNSTGYGLEIACYTHRSKTRDKAKRTFCCKQSIGKTPGPLGISLRPRSCCVCQSWNKMISRSIGKKPRRLTKAVAATEILSLLEAYDLLSPR